MDATEPIPAGPAPSKGAAWDRSRHNPRLIMTIGLYGSASTWVFNVARELMVARHGTARVRALYSDTVAKVVEDRQVLGRYLVWKMHYGEPQWDVFAQLADPTIVLSVRDPRDAALSMVNRFNTALELAVHAVGRCCNRVLQCAAGGFPVLRYEDGFFRDPDCIRKLAGHLGVAADDATVSAIFARYTTEAVRSFAEGVERLPTEQVKGDPAVDLYDDVTQIHRGHIGDTSVAKWRHQLTADQQQAITTHFAPFLQRFGYA